MSYVFSEPTAENVDEAVRNGDYRTLRCWASELHRMQAFVQEGRTLLQRAAHELSGVVALRDQLADAQETWGAILLRDADARLPATVAGPLATMIDHANLQFVWRDLCTLTAALNELSGSENLLWPRALANVRAVLQNKDGEIRALRAELEKQRVAVNTFAGYDPAKDDAELDVETALARAEEIRDHSILEAHGEGVREGLKVGHDRGRRATFKAIEALLASPLYSRELLSSVVRAGLGDASAMHGLRELFPLFEAFTDA